MPTNPFISLFGRSPIGPMQQHIAKAHECAAGLLPFFRAVIAEDWAQVEQVQQDMVRLEQEADRLKKNVRMHLPKSLFLPVPRPICWSCSVYRTKSPIAPRTSPG